MACSTSSTDNGRLVRAKGVVEKPDPAEAPSNLTIIGRYIIQPEVFGHLERIEAGQRQRDPADRRARRADRRRPGISTACASPAGAIDCGDKLGFLEANVALGLQHPSSAPGCADILKTTAERHELMATSFRPDDPARIRHSRHRRHDPVRRRCASARAAPSPATLGERRRAASRVAVGYDGRLTSPELEAALVDGLAAGGADVVRIGRGPTPMLYYAAATLGGRRRDHGHRLAQPARP